MARVVFAAQPRYIANAPLIITFGVDLDNCNMIKPLEYGISEKNMF